MYFTVYSGGELLHTFILEMTYSTLLFWW